MGSMFSFVSSEISEKIKVLEDLRNGEQRDDFATLFTMTDFETTQNLLVKKDYTSGSRTLLRLHRGLGNETNNNFKKKKNIFVLFLSKLHLCSGVKESKILFFEKSKNLGML